MKNVTFTIVTVGSGGYRLGDVIRNKFIGENRDVKVISVNTALPELDTANADIKIHMTDKRDPVYDTYGVGGDRKVGYDRLVTNITMVDKLIDTISKKMINKDKLNVILVTYSTGGGTGSAMGTRFLTSISNKLDNDSVVTIGLPIIAGRDEGMGKVVNSYECVEELLKSITLFNTRYIMVKNDYCETSDTDDTLHIYTKYDKVNSDVADSLSEFFTIKQTDNGGVIDGRDRWKAIGKGGIHTICKIYNTDDNVENYSIGPFKFEGSNISHVDNNYDTSFICIPEGKGGYSNMNGVVVSADTIQRIVLDGGLNHKRSRLLSLEGFISTHGWVKVKNVAEWCRESVMIYKTKSESIRYEDIDQVKEELDKIGTDVNTVKVNFIQSNMTPRGNTTMQLLEW